MQTLSMLRERIRTMSRHFNAPHPDRKGRHTYSKKRKSRDADRYGVFTNGKQDSPDKVAGKTVMYPREEIK